MSCMFCFLFLYSCHLTLPSIFQSSTTTLDGNYATSSVGPGPCPIAADGALDLTLGATHSSLLHSAFPSGGGSGSPDICEPGLTALPKVKHNLSPTKRNFFLLLFLLDLYVQDINQCIPLFAVID